MKLMRDVCVFSLGLQSQLSFPLFPFLSLSFSLFRFLARAIFHCTAFYVHSAVAAYIMGAYGSLVPITNDRNYIQIDSQIGPE